MKLSKEPKYRNTILVIVLTMTAFISLLNFGCSSHKPPEPDEIAIPVQVPLSFSTTGTTTSSAKWWENFNDENLNDLVTKALSDNLSIKSGFARIDKARAQLTSSRSRQRITADASLNASIFNNGNNSPLNQGTSKSYSLSVPASYEVDLFDRLHNQTNAAATNILLNKYALEAIAQTLAANVSETWFNILRTQKELELSNKQTKLNQTYLELMEVRFSQGQATALDVYQQRQQLANTRLLLPAIKAEKDVLKNQLAILLGKAPGITKLPKPEIMPLLPPLPKTGLPINLLDNRPDVKQAFARILIANSNLAAAISRKKPSLKISAEPGFGSVTPTDLFSGFLWRLGASLMAPVLDGGRIKANIFHNEAEVEESLNEYGSVIINAISEVENALIREKYQKEQIKQIKQNISLTKDTLREAKLRYMHGLIDYLPSITALTALQALERKLVSAQQKLLSHRLSLYRALGGDWSARWLNTFSQKINSSSQKDSK